MEKWNETETTLETSENIRTTLETSENIRTTLETSENIKTTLETSEVLFSVFYPPMLFLLVLPWHPLWSIVKVSVELVLIVRL